MQIDHVRASLQFARRLLCTEEGRKDLADTQRLLDDPEQQEYVNAVAQPYDGWSIGQVAALGRFNALFHLDVVKAVCVPVGAVPCVDGGQERNRAALRQGLPSCFTALVPDTDGPQGKGTLSWHPAAGSQMPGAWTTSAPLAIGYADASQTLQHLFDFGMVARWPHRSTDLWVFGFTVFTAWVAAEAANGA